MKRPLLFYTLILSLFCSFLTGNFKAQEFSSQAKDKYGEALNGLRNGSCLAFTATPSSTPVSCNGFDDGEACISVPTDGVGPFTYLWLGETSTTNCISNVDAGSYIVIVTDVGQGASCSWEITVSEPTSIGVIAMNATPPSCVGLCDATANPLVVGGNGGYMFNYDSGETTQAASMLCDPFELTITDANGCTTDTTFVFTNAPDTIRIDAIVTDNICFDLSDGEIDATATGGVGTYDFVWTGPNSFSETTEDIAGLEPGVYQVMVTDDNGCMQTDSFTVDTATEITIDAIIVDVVCFGDSTGVIDITVGGGNPDYTYDWSGPSGFLSNDEDITDLKSGTYDLTVTDITGCTKDTSFFVDENSQILVSALVTDNDCFGDSLGAIDITVTSLLGVASYAWVGPGSFTSGSQDISDLISGDYTVTITDLGGCQKDTTISVQEPDELQLDFLITDILCNGDSTGAIDLTVNGGTPGYTVDWTGPSGFTDTVEDINDLIAGDYTVTVTDLNLCQKDTTVTITEPLVISVVESITDLLCNSDSTGAIEIDITGGTGLYTTSWIGPDAFSSNDEDVFDLQAGFYNLLVEDENGCEFDALYEVTQPDSLQLDMVSTDLNCAADSTGAIDITVTGGTGTYTYIWIGPGTFSSTDEDISDLQAGVYNVQVEDDNACTINDSIEIFEPTPLSFDTTITDISCAGITDGEIDLEISGGTGLYDIQWTGPGSFSATTEDIDSLSAGIYTVVVTDENFCSDSINVEIIEPGAIDIVGVVTDVECNGDMDGEIDITVTLGAGGYTFDWVGPGTFSSTDEDITDLFGGVYVVNVTDANMCTAVATFEVEQNQVIIIDAVVDQIDCAGDSTGAINVTVSGGQAGYVYSWTGPSSFTSTQEDISDLIAGTYILTVEDMLGCTEQETYFISEPLALSITASLQDPFCFGEENGDIDIAINGGTPDYFIEWVGPSGFNESGMAIDIDNLEAGDYDLTITDALGCTLDTTFTLVEPADLIATLDLTDPGCDLDNGSAVSTVSGGTVAADYTYYWLNSSGDTIGFGFELTGLGAGSYTFIVLDDNNCTVTIPFELSDDVGTISALIDNVSCFNETNGAIDVEVTGLSGTLDVSWTGPGTYSATTLDISGLEAGDYTISIEDDLGCTLVETYTVDSPDEIVILGNVTNESCADLDDGQIDITVSGGQGTLTYSWSDGGTFNSIDEDIFNLAPGTYTVTVTDTSFCSSQQSFDVLPAVDYAINGSITDIDCAGDMNGAIDISSVPVLVGATYSWDGPGAYTASTEDISGLEPGLYILSTTTAEFCLFVDSFLVSENDSIIADLVTSPSVCGTNSGSASLTVTGGEVAVDYTYSFFSLPDGTVISTFSSVGSLDGGLYGYTVTDDNGCQTSGTFTISDDFGTLDAVVQGVTCEGEDDGSIELTVTGLTGMTTISWVGPGSYTSSDEDIFDLEAGIYTVTITDENGCVLGDTYEVDEGVGILITGTVTDILCFEDDNGAIDMEFSGGQTPYDISWIGPGTFTAAQEDINDLEPGDYSVTITDLNGCNGTADFTVTEPELLDVEAFITPLVCNGDFSGAIEINILGGTGPYDINWIGPNPYTSTFEDISGLEAGTYSLSISDDNSCAFSADYDVLQPDALVITLLQLVNSSCDLDIGLLEVEASGGNSPYQFTWTNSSGFEVSDQALADDLSADTYTVIIEDEDGCTNTEDYIISNQEAFLDGVVDSVSCNGLSDGSIDLEVTGTITGNADTLWTGPGGFTATSEDIAGLLAGDYTVTIEDDASCVFTETFTVFEPDTILVSGTSEPVNCSGLTDGAIYIDVVGGVGGYEYSWTGPSTFTSSDEDLSDLEPGIYNLTVSDIIPCSVDFSIEVLEPDSILISQDTLIDPSCVGLGDGVISITVTGGNGGYDYDWSGSGFSSTQEDLTNLGPGVYDLTVTDDSSCTQMSSFELTNVQVLDIAATTTDLVCFGVDQGEIDLTITGGNGTYTFDWVGPIPFTSSDEDINGLAAGAYDILVTDSIGCQRDSIFTIVQPDSIEVAVIGLENVSCAGFSDGSIDIEVSGGVPDYTYSWSGPAAFSDIDQDIFDLVSGTYIVSVTDLNDCIMIDSVSVMQPDSIELSGIVEPVNCNGDENGSISIDASGGSGIYDYEWVGPGPFMSDDEDISNLAPGIYTVTVSDDVPCVAEFSFEVLEPDSILIDEDGLIDPTCSGLSDGAIAITVQGGNGGYEYQWNGPGFNSTLEDINNLGPGDYNITVTDDSMCVETASFTLNDIQVMDLDVDIDSIACFGDDGAAIDITVSGGNGGFGFEWTGPSPFSSVDEDIADLIPGDYTLLITDALGCELDSIINIFEPDSLIIANVDNVQATCNGFDDGAIFLDIEGGMAEFSYSWIGPGSFTADTEDITDLIAGQYTLTVTDANDCVATQDINVDEPLPLNLTLDVINDAECENTLDGNIFITVTGGNSGYIYDWMGPNAFDSNEEDIIGVLPGDYILNVSDQFGCIISDAYLIDFEVAISVDAGDYGPVCNGEELILSGQGGPPGSDFSWSTPQGPDFSSELTASVQISPSNDVFILTATNGNCIASDTTTIEVLATPTPDAGEDVEVFLDDLVILGGDPTWIDAQSYSWSPSLNLDDPSSSNPTYQAVGEQLFTLIVIGSNGCIGIDEVLITINPSLDIPSGFTPNGDNRNETWIIQNTELFPEMIVRIFNRWGDELWTSGIGYPQEWDGKYEESILPVGTYYYVIELNDSRFPDALTGPITIFR